MPQFKHPEELLTCSFCGKSQNDVRKLIAGPGVYVCNECIDICNEIINDDEAAAFGATVLELIASEGKLTDLPLQ